ncbi:uncharacterized protein LOC142341170 [Convolutriloba macropyga]|uniref:uncharacterized protein LOC142341170 n=1 Tax=Convolutriloba macropyga TaxID=536237 RepID=UPI003F51D765
MQFDVFATRKIIVLKYALFQKKTPHAQTVMALMRQFIAADQHISTINFTTVVLAQRRGTVDRTTKLHVTTWAAQDHVCQLLPTGSISTSMVTLTQGGQHTKRTTTGP